jgi:hypothetical protein
MEQEQVEKIIRQYILNNLEIETKLCGGDYGSKKFVEIKLKLNENPFSSCYIDIN